MDLLTSLDLQLTRLRSEFAAINVLIKLRKLARAVELASTKAGFDPNQPRDDRGQWTSGGGPEIPEKRPTTAKERNRVVKETARWLLRRAGPIGRLVAVGSWLYDHYPYIQAYLDSPKSLEELGQAVSTPKTGYDIHHIVEQTPAEQDSFSRSVIDSRENLVRIPTLKHWEINAWYQTRNEDYGFLSPRDYLRGKDWDERLRVGHYALIKFGVLKP